MAGAAVGSSTVPPVTPWPLVAVSRLVPSRLISASRPACEEADRPSTATIAATPIAIPSADRPARNFRVRSPTVESRARSDSLEALPRQGGGAGHDGGPLAGRVSATIRPSMISTLRGIRSAIAWSCVMTTIVEPAWWSWSIRARMDCPVA